MNQPESEALKQILDQNADKIPQYSIVSDRISKIRKCAHASVNQKQVHRKSRGAGS